MLHEIRHAARALLRAPGTAALVAVTLGVAIGAVTAVASVADGVLLHPLPFREADRLLMLWQRAPGVGVTEDWFSVAQYFDVRNRVPDLEEAALLWGSERTLTGGDAEPRRVGTLAASSSFFQLLGIAPAHGRVLADDADVPGSPLQVLIGHELFQTRFGSDPAIVGKTLTLDGSEAEVVGVLPRLPLDADLFPTLFTVPVFEMVTSLPVENPGRTTRGSENFNVLVRQRPGASRAELETELLALADHLSQDPGSLGAGLEAGTEYRIAAVPLLEQAVGPVRRPLFAILAATVLLLITACATVANLLLARATSARRELGIRAALGAPRRRVVVRSFVESAMLAATGGLVGGALAAGFVQLLGYAAPPGLPRLEEIAVDPGVLGLTACLCAVAALAFGVGPAIRSSSVGPGEALRNAAVRGDTAQGWRRGGSRWLVALQVALSLLLAAGAGLMARTVQDLRAVDPGFRPDGVLSFRVALAGDRYVDRDERVRFFETLLDKLRAAPGVSASGGGALLPFTRGYAWTDFVAQGHEDDDRARVVADMMVASEGYFEALDVPLLAGRTFTAADEGEPATVVVNRAFADRFWRREEAVGKWVAEDGMGQATVVGVVENIRHYGLDSEVRPAVFYPYRAVKNRGLYIAARHDADPATLAPLVREMASQIDASQPVYDVRTMSQRLDDSLARPRLLSLLLHLFSVVALVLATSGLYGVVSYWVAARTHELGLRKALGARRRNLIVHVLRGAGVVVLAGTIAGVLAVRAAGGLLASVVAGAHAVDALSLGGAVVLVLAVSACASLIPALRAARTPAVIALRTD